MILSVLQKKFLMVIGSIERIETSVELFFYKTVFIMNFLYNAIQIFVPKTAYCF